MLKYIVTIDETYRLNGDRNDFVFDKKEEAVSLYEEQRKGFASIVEEDGSGNKSILKDIDGRKYIKGSPFYNFPHVPHKSIIDGKEIETT